MKQRHTIFLALIFSGSLLASLQEQFETAKGYYKQQQFAQAFELYNNIPVKNSAVLCNMGNCNYHLSNFVGAQVQWRRAQKNAGLSAFSDCAYNIAVAESQINQHEAPWQIRLFHSLGRLSCAFPLLMIQLIFLVCWFLLFKIASRLYAAKRYIILAFFWLITMVLGFILGIICMVQIQGIAVITQAESSVFTGPHGHFQVLGHLQAGDEVLVKYHEDPWYKIQGKNIVGWVLKDNLELIN